MTCSSPCAIQARDWPPPLSRSLQGLPHDQAQCPGTRAVDLSLDHRRARRTIVGERQFAPGRGLSIHVAHQTRRFSAPMMCRRAPACSDPRRPLCGRKPRSSHRVSKGSCWRAAKARRSLGSPRLLKSASSRFPPFLEAERDLHPFVEMRWLTLGIKTLSRKVLARTPRELRAAGRTDDDNSSTRRGGQCRFRRASTEARPGPRRVFLHLRDLVYLHREAASANTIAFVRTLEAAVIAEKAAREKRLADARERARREADRQKEA
jgi:hypothetical protein